MAKIDKTREEIGWMKLLFTLSFGAFIPLIIWVLQDPSEYISFIQKTLNVLPYTSSPESVVWSVVVTSIPIVLMGGSLVMLMLGIRRKIDELEGL